MDKFISCYLEEVPGYLSLVGVVGVDGVVGGGWYEKLMVTS